MYSNRINSIYFMRHYFLYLAIFIAYISYNIIKSAFDQSNYIRIAWAIWAF